MPFRRYIKACNKRNKPCFLKPRNVLLVFLVVIFIEFLFLANFVGRISFEDFLARIVPEELVELTNIRREKVEVKALNVNPLLVSAAQMKADDMAEKGYFAHTSPEGVTPWYWFDAAGYNYRHAGENLAVNFTETHRVDQAWMDSPTHKRNIINESFEEIGIATAVGEYKGNREAVFVVQLFGSGMEIPPLASIVEEEEEILVEEEIDDVVTEEEEEIVTEETVEETVTEETVEETVTEETVEEVEKEESFAFMEKTDDEVILSVGEPEDVISISREEPEYVSFWGKIISSPIRSLTHILVIVSAILLFSLLLKFLLMQRMNLTLMIANEMIIIFVIFSAFLVNHYVLYFFS